jgi:hypothetical protein
MEPENSKLLSFLKDHHRLFAHYLLGNTVLLLLLAWISHVVGLEAADVRGIRGVLTVALVLLVAVCLGGAVIIAICTGTRLLRMLAVADHQDRGRSGQMISR